LKLLEVLKSEERTDDDDDEELTQEPLSGRHDDTETLRKYDTHAVFL